MQSILQQRFAGLQALRLRSIIATSEFYSMIGKEQPVQEIRFQVVTKGQNAYHVIERATNKVKGFRFSWKAAINLAQVLEARANGAKVNIEGWDK